MAFGGWDDEQAKADAKAAQKKGGGKFITLQQGENVLRFLPPLEGEKGPFLVTYTHGVTMPDGKYTSFPCPRMTASKACPLCAKAKKLEADPRTMRKARDYFPRTRVYARVVDRSAPENGVGLFAFGKGVFERLAKIRTSPKLGGDFTRVQKGRDIVIVKTGEKLNTEYEVVADPDGSSPLGTPEEIERWGNEAKPWDVELTEVLSAEDIIAICNGDDPRQARRTKGGSDEDEDSPAPRGRGRGRGRTVQDDVEEESGGGAADDGDIPF